MIPCYLLQRIVAHPVQTRITNMADRQKIVVEQARHQRGTHSGTVRIFFRRVEYCLVCPCYLLLQHRLRQRHCVIAAQFCERVFGPRFRQPGRDQRSRHSAGNFTRVVATHSIGKHDDSQVRPGLNAVLVVAANPARIRAAYNLQSVCQRHISSRHPVCIFDMPIARAAPANSIILRAHRATKQSFPCAPHFDKPRARILGFIIT